MNNLSKVYEEKLTSKQKRDVKDACMRVCNISPQTFYSTLEKDPFKVPHVFVKAFSEVTGIPPGELVVVDVVTKENIEDEIIRNSLKG